MATSVVSGAAGFIGSHLVERLLNDGWEVVGIDNFTTGQKRNLESLANRDGFIFLEQDISEPVSIQGPVAKVFNFACPASPIDFGPKALEILRVCADGTRNLLELALEKGAIFIQASTSECYGDPEVHPQREDYWGRVNPIGHRSPYDEGKRYAEAMIMAYHRTHALRTRMGRIFNTYGPRMRVGDGRVLPNFIQQALEGRPLSVYGQGEQTRSFCYVSDLVDGFIRLSESDEITPVNLGFPEELKILELAHEVIELVGSVSTIEYLPLPSDDPCLRRPDISKAQRLLGWQPQTDRRSGLERTIAYFRTVLQ